ncbi:hypothetical protein ACLB2K_031322 [Fragaria x ananassa]
MPPRRRPRVATSTNANEGEEVRGLADSIGAMLRGVLDRVQPPRSVKKRDVADAGAVEFKGVKGPLDAYSWVDKIEIVFESTELPEEKKVKMTVSFLDDSAHHWWTLTRRNNDGAQTMTWEQFKTLFLGLAYSNSGELLVSYSDELIYLFQKHMGLCPPLFQPEDMEEVDKPAQLKNGGELVRFMTGDSLDVYDIQPHPHNPVIATCGSENNLKLWAPVANDDASPLPDDIAELLSPSHAYKSS